ncbi:MAG: inositol monophosphatase, partial [Alphaproteobacteria bacterium]|nr:inositol monophosphatase [Alphaproteobacteria bacterium]
MQKINHEEVENILREVAETIILPRFRNLHEGDIDFKIGDDPVTIADKEAELALSTRLSALLPGSTVVGEEAFFINPGVLSRFSGESPVWIIDPIDGTRAFVGGEPEFGIIVALAEQNQTVAGWHYDPTSKEVVSAEKGAGAYHNGRKLRVLAPDLLQNMVGSIIETPAKESFAATPVWANGLPEARKPNFMQITYSCHEYPRLVVAGPHFSYSGQQRHFRVARTFCTPWDDAA